MISSLREAKARFSELVALAAQGEEVVITVHGRPQAVLCPLPKEGKSSHAMWLKTLRETRAAYTVGRTKDSGAILDDLRGERV
jgi:prevent-host-death family protein